jgi:hypothetical protein
MFFPTYDHGLGRTTDLVCGAYAASSPARAIECRVLLTSVGIATF